VQSDNNAENRELNRQSAEYELNFFVEQIIDCRIDAAMGKLSDGG
jgi:hypothetical protein